MFLLLLLALAPTASLAAPPSPDCKSCSLSPSPVCKNGVEYQNECLARCQGVKNANKGSCDPAGPAADIKKTEERYSTDDTVSWEEMREMSKQGYHFTGRTKLLPFKQDNQGKGGKSDDGKASPLYRRHVAVTFPKGNTYTKLTVEDAPEDSTIFVPAFVPPGAAVANVSGNNGPVNGKRRSLVVIGSDNRVQITSDAYPYRAGAWLSFSDGGWCSAALIGPQIAITAGHCIYDRDTSRWYNVRNMRVTPGLRSGGVAKYGSTTVRRAVTYSGYTKSGLTRYDIAVLYLGSPIGYKSGWFGIGYKCGAATYNLQKVGYPSDKLRTRPKTMWWSTCRVYKDMCSESDLIHDCDTFSGDSGAGMWKGDDKWVRAAHSGSRKLSDGRTRNVAATVRPNTWSIFKEAIATTPR